jgi:DNA-3-methyladenine glycosylase II
MRPSAPLDTGNLQQARAWLAARDPALAHMDAQTPPFAWRTSLGGFAGLVRVIVGQQVSIAAAAAIWARLEAGLGGVTPDAVVATDVQGLRALGLSAPKARYVRAIAEAHIGGATDLEGLHALDDVAAAQALCALTGVGRWTADIYLMFCEGRRDVFPAGDLALQEGLRIAQGWTVRPTERELLARAELWRPHRGVAAHLIWAYYGALRRRGATPLAGVETI